MLPGYSHQPPGICLRRSCTIVFWTSILYWEAPKVSVKLQLAGKPQLSTIELSKRLDYVLSQLLYP